jgi:hypothetical protein
MKVLIIAILCLNTGLIHAQSDAFTDDEAEILVSEPIDVDGYLKEKKSTDGELEGLHAEIEKQKAETILNKEKSKSYQELTKSVEKLSETTEEYLEEKRAAKEEIANYNMKVKCLSSDEPGPECSKYVRRR